MKKLLPTLLLLLALPFTLQMRGGNEFRPGQIWPDNHGRHINAHGGGLLLHEGVYYWFGEHKSDTTSAAMVGVTCYRSQNLTDWTDCGIALKVSEEKGSDIEKGCILERPKVIYNSKTRKFVMWFHLELKGRGYQAARAGVAVSDRPEGPYTFLRSSRVNAYRYPVEMTREDVKALDTIDAARYEKWWTPEWRKAIVQGLFLKRDYAGGQMARDMTLFVDDDRKAYHIFASEDNLTLQIAELSEDYTFHTGKYTRVAAGGQNEAPTLFKRKGRYWMITSGCTGWAPNKARMFTAQSIWGPWEQLPNPCEGPDADKTFGGQGTYVLKVPHHEDLYIFMADVWRPQHPSDARYIWLPIEFRNDIPVIPWRTSWVMGDE